jgi:hypothetical protein
MMLMLLKHYVIIHIQKHWRGRNGAVYAMTVG